MFRDPRGHGRSLRQHVTFHELTKEFPQLNPPRWGARVPSGWDDLLRQDAFDRTWKRHRNTQYRTKAGKKPARPKVKVTYDTPWVGHSSRCRMIRYTNERGELDYLRRYSTWIRFRVRDAYRRHRVGNEG